MELCAYDKCVTNEQNTPDPEDTDMTIDLRDHPDHLTPIEAVAYRAALAHGQDESARVREAWAKKS